jgi:hypothetical protein
MAMIVWVVSAVAGLYGLGWFVFAFVNPPSMLSFLYRSPSMFYFLSDRGARFMMGAICIAVSVFASFIVPMFWS